MTSYHTIPFEHDSLTPRCRAILTDPAASDWLKLALAAALERDPVDAAHDAEILAELLRDRCDGILFAGAAVLNINDQLKGKR